MDSHPRVKHPHELMIIERDVSRFNNWVTDHLSLALGSVTGMWLSLVVPLLALPIPALAKIVVIISSNWIQLWALFSLQRTANRADARREAKADADHEALTHIAHKVDDIYDYQIEGRQCGENFLGVQRSTLACWEAVLVLSRYPGPG